MEIRPPLVVALSALAAALAVAPAHAGSSRVATVSIPCDGSLQHQVIPVTGFAASTMQFILGGDVAVVDAKHKLDHLLIRAEDNEQKQLMTIGPGVTHAEVSLPTFFQVSADASGNVFITVDAQCRKGPDLTAYLTLYFN